MVQDDALDGVAADLAGQVVERAADARVAPPWIRPRHRHGGPLDLSGGLWPPDAADAAAVVLPGRQPSRPSKQRVGRHDGPNPEQTLAPYPLGGRSQKASLSVGQSQSPAAEVLSENPIFGLQGVDDVLLAAVHPAGHGREQEWEGWREHGPERRLPTRRTVGRGCSLSPRATPRRGLRFCSAEF